MRKNLMTVQDWNDMYTPGTPVRYWPIRGLDDHKDTKTRSEAWTLPHGAGIVLLEGISGGVDIEHCRALVRQPEPQEG